MGRNFFSEFKRGLEQTFNPMTSRSQDPTGVTKIFNFPATNMPHINPIADIGGDILTGIEHGLGLGGGFLPPSMNPLTSHRENALSSVKDMTKKLLGMVNEAVKIVGGVDALAKILGIPTPSLVEVLKDPDTTANMRQLGDVAGVVAGVINFVGGSIADPFTALLAEQIGILSQTVTSAADLIDSANRVSGHWDNGDYAAMLKEMAGMTQTLKGVVSDEAAEDLRLDELNDRLNGFSEKAKKAQEVRDMTKKVLDKLNTKEAQDQLDIAELEEDQSRDAENFRQQQAELDELKLLEVADTEELREGQEKLSRGQEQIEAQNRRVLAEEGVLESNQLINRALQREQIKSLRTNTQMLKDIGSDNRHETQAIKHKQVILDNELQKLDTDERDEIDATLRMATKLDPPRTAADFIKDLDSYETNPHRIQYIAENYDQFIRLPQSQIDNLLEKMLDMGVGVAF